MPRQSLDNCPGKPGQLLRQRTHETHKSRLKQRGGDLNKMADITYSAGVWKSQPGEGQRSGAGGGMAEVTYHKTKMCVSVRR